MDKQTKSNMPLDESKLSFQISRTDHPREKIIKLGEMITDRMGAKITGNDPEYWGFASLVTDEMADVALKMKVRKPKTLAQIAKITGKDPAHLEKLLTKMAYIGIVEYNWENLDGKNPNHEKRWVLPQYIPGSAEFLNMRQSQIDEHPEVAAFFERMTFLPLEKVSPMVPPGGAGIGMHVIPVEKAIEMESKSVSVEHISHWLKKYDKYAASPCSCRMSRAKLGEGCGDDPENWCIGVGDMATYLVETDRGHYISYDEALEILRKAEDNGFVHQISNIDGEEKIIGICNSNVNISNALRTSQLFNTPNLSRSAYVAKVKTDNCVACGRCVEVCPAGAVKLGQKLCAKDGSTIQYPRHELPDDTAWGPDKWDVDYRDNNRINCYDTGTAPCKTACPAHIAVQGYLKLAAQGKYTEALELIKRENPFPAVCGRVCNRRCEDACTRGTIDQAVAIDEVKKFIAQQDLNAERRFVPEKVIPKVEGEFSQKIAIIGGGPAGLSCAFYLALKGYEPTVFEKNKELGGMLRYGIPSFKLEKDVIDAEIDVIRALGVDFRCGVEVGKDLTLDDLRAQGYEAFYIAIGCQRGRLPGIPGESSKGVYSAVEFLRAAAEGNGLQVPGKTVVVGGGNVAIDAARTAHRCGAESVQMFCLEPRDKMPASLEEIAEAEDEDITIQCSWGPKEILTEGGKVSGIVFMRCTSVWDGQGRFAPQYDEQDTITVPCDHVVLSIGQSVEWGELLEGSKVELARGGWAKADSLTYQTAQPDVFVGGDVYTGPKFAIDAIAAGKEAAVSLHRFVQPNTSMTIGRNRRQFIELDKGNIKVEQYDNAQRQIPGMDDSIDWKKSFRDAKRTFTEEQVKTETARCLGCGASIVDPNKCIGCGVCTTKCAFDAIHLHRERPECSKMVRSEDKMKAILPYTLKRQIKIKRAARKAKK